MTVVLDSWAVMAWLNDESPAADIVDEAFTERPTMNWINLVEVAYRVERERGRATADQTVADIRRVIDADLPGTGRMLAAARIKAANAIALGGCFALATAAALDAELWTGDPEILELPDPGCRVRDLRAASASNVNSPASAVV